jgi:subtilisin family serine protease
MFAPGVDVLTTTITASSGSPPYPPNPSFKVSLRIGTSYSAPNVAGLVALFCQQYPSYTPAQIKQLVVASATPNKLYTTGSTTDYADNASLCGAPNLIAYSPFNNINEQFLMTGAITASNVTITTSL